MYLSLIYHQERRKKLTQRSQGLSILEHLVPKATDSALVDLRLIQNKIVEQAGAEQCQA